MVGLKRMSAILSIVLAAGSVFLCFQGYLFAATNNPFPERILKGPLAVGVEVFASIPDSAGSFARVNQLLASPDGTLFVLDQRGSIYQVSADGSNVSSYLVLGSQVALRTSNEQGLQSMAFHPDFYSLGEPGYGKLYTIHSSSDKSPAPDFRPGGGFNAHDTVLLEWTTAAPSAVPFEPETPAAPFREVMRLEQPYSNHNAGLIAFNPNAQVDDADYGKLYVAIGDGGSSGDPLDLSQDATNPYGAILRIDPLASGGSAYTIPEDNPFVGDSSKLDEIWAYGLRNPQRFYWDSENRMLIADIGQGVVEEINLGVAGGNYGWNEREGSYEYISTGSVSDSNARGDASATGYVYPIAEYDHGEGNAVTAGFVYEGPVDSHLVGKFLFGDIRRGRVFFFDATKLPEGGQETIQELRLLDKGTEKSFLSMIQESNPETGRADLRFGQDSAGTLYLLNKKDGKIRKVTPLPRTRIVGTELQGGFFALQFFGQPGVSDWGIKGGSDLNEFSDDLTPATILTEPRPGHYEAEIDLRGFPNTYFIRIIRE